MRAPYVIAILLFNSCLAQAAYAQQISKDFTAEWKKCTTSCGYQVTMTKEEQARVAACMEKCDDKYLPKKK
jgi:hypothetical protein